MTMVGAKEEDFQILEISLIQTPISSLPRK